ncbi:MAG: class I SAM-dependent methyltransferase [Trueperaceae bacterium]|nr:class I SAM-dependent methyltransferase [Trueperaceae bacterium]
MNDLDRGQVNTSAAEVYEEFFLPALFQDWAQPVIKAAQIQAGQCVLDVACGTGVLARAALEAVNSSGKVTGLDINESMLEVARIKAPAVEWYKGQAEQMPFDVEQFDAVISQFGLMFFEDKPAALKEMMRVLKVGGRLAVAVWNRLEHTPGYAAMTELLRRLFGDEAAKSLEAPYILGDVTQLETLFSQAGMPGVGISTIKGIARFASIDAWVHTDIKGWILADRIDEKQYQTLLSVAQKDLASFVTNEGTVIFDAPAHIITWQKG